MSRDREIAARSSLSRSSVLEQLLAQHAELRVIIEHCERLADELGRGNVEPAVLTREVARLRIAFDTHNRCEERFLRPLLADSGAFAEVRLDQMVFDHVEEHQLMRGGLHADVVEELRTTLVHLRDHLATEERYFLSAQALRDDLVVLESGS
jgi:hemerythrin-like domain-containing protein